MALSPVKDGTKCLVIGDTHYDNPYSGYLEAQLTKTKELIESSKAKYVVFLGDIFHHRKPNPEVIVSVKRLFDRVSLTPGLSRIIILRGNHDSASKSDDGLTVLDVLDWPGSKVQIVSHTELDEELNMLFIPHYENENTIHESLAYAPNESTIVFGHFGYEGSINAAGFFDFSLNLDSFKNRTILGHIHKYTKNGNVTILGTPWATNFGECDYPHYVGTLTYSKGKWTDMDITPVEGGVRYYAAPFESLEVMRDEISDPSYFTILRVLLDKFSDESTNAVRSSIKEDFGVAYVDLKFQPVLDKKLSDRLSGYDSNVPLNNIDDDIIQQYINEQTTSIPKEDLENGLKLIREYEDSSS